MSTIKKNIWIFNHYAGPPSIVSGLRHYNFGKELIKKGYSTKIFASSEIHNGGINMIKGDESYIEDSNEGVPFVYVKTRSYSGNKMKRIMNMIDYYRGLFKVIKNFEKPDVIVASSVHPLTCIAGIKIAKKLGVPCICEIRDLWPESFVSFGIVSKKNPILIPLYAGEKWIYKKANRMIFTMEGGPDYIVEKGWNKENGGPIDLGNIHHINNGIDLEEFENNVNNIQIIDNDLEDGKTFKIIYTGSIRKANHLETLVDTAWVLKENKDVKFLIYGDGDQVESLTSRVNELGLKNIVFKGRVQKNEVPYILSKADLNIIQYQPAGESWKYGGSMNKLFEYFASGKPVLSTVEMSYDLIKKHNCGIVTRNQDPQTIADAVLGIKQMSANEYETICANSKKVAKEYDFSNLTEKLIGIIEEL